MKLEIEPCSACCFLKVFKINGIKADSSDFGHQEDVDETNAPDYGCGNMQFISKHATQDVLDKYDITVEDYNEILNELDRCLSFGYCDWCSQRRMDMKSHIIGTSIPENKPDADKKKRSIKAISELLAFGMLTNAMSNGGYNIEDDKRNREEE